MVDLIFTFDVVIIILLIKNNSFEIEKGGEEGGGLGLGLGGGDMSLQPRQWCVLGI